MRRIYVEAFKMAPKKAKLIEEGDKAFSCTKSTRLQTEKIGKLSKGNMKTLMKGFSKDLLPRFPMPHKYLNILTAEIRGFSR